MYISIFLYSYIFNLQKCLVRMVLLILQLRYQLYHSNLPNLTGMSVICMYSQFKLFKTKVEFAFKGTNKYNPGHAKVGGILNWLGDTAFEIYGNVIWTAAADKDDPLKVLKAFEDYFKPAQNKYHYWYSLGGIYSSQFKSQSEFMVKLHECVRECSFEKPDEVVKFLFLMHNQNVHVCEELLKSM